MDKNFCVVLVIHECEDGEEGDLCFKELGIRLRLYSGDAVLFRSQSLSHFNLHFKGLRASIVFHSDKMANTWIKDRNGWAKNKFMNA